MICKVLGLRYYLKSILYININSANQLSKIPWWCYCVFQTQPDNFLQHALMMNPVSAKKMVMVLQEAYPARPKVNECNERFIFNQLEMKNHRECIFSTSLLQCRLSTTSCRCSPFLGSHNFWVDKCQMVTKLKMFFLRASRRKRWERETRSTQRLGVHTFRCFSIPHNHVDDWYVFALILSWLGQIIS